jgi:O-antigen/teichoic acid export membrane protein
MMSTVVGSVLGFVFWMAVARLYTPDEIGLATALISAANLLVVFSLLGFNFGILRFLPNEEDKQGMINSCLTVTFLFSILLSAIFILSIDIWSPALLFIRENIIFLLFFVVFVFTTAFTQLQWSVFVALRSAKFSFIHNITLSVLKLIFVLYLVAFGVFGIFSSWAIAACIALIVSTFFLTPKRVHPYLPIPTIKRKIIKDMFHISSGNYIAENFGAIPNSVLPLMIINVLNPEMNAYFFMALAISNILITVPVAVNSSLFVEGSYAPEQFRNNVITAIKFTFLLIVPMILGIFIFGDKLLLLFGKAYSENGFYVLCILVLSVIPFTINKVYFTIKNIQLKVKPIIYLNVLISILTIAISYVLMIKLGLIGAAIGYTLGQGTGAAVVCVSVWKEGWF